MESSKFNEALRDESVNEISRENAGLSESDELEFIHKVGKRFLQKKIEYFPTLCEITRMQNYLKWKELEEHGNRGRFTNSVGWSQDGNFKFEYEIPSELYLFMTNLVWVDFWSEENRKVWRKFMKKICDSEPSMETLAWAQSMCSMGREQDKLVVA